MSDASPTKRCVVYTRKSSEEGLEQSFNSLDAQREAGEAYIQSQQHEGWTLLPNQYNDGGISGGTMERPGLQQLLSDVRDGQIDVVVVYKVDRLSRSLGDFAQIIDLFDQHHVSFVSVTQQFNTTTSMGRLTLNILLSFAQFEREVTGERIRDKIALSKQRGMWMGGFVPLGYDAVDRKLVVNREEARLVKKIFQRFAELQSVTALCRELKEQGYRGKARRDGKGRIRQRALDKAALYKILNNRLYLGEIRHKESWFPGEHQPIIDQKSWEAAQAVIKTEPARRTRGGDCKTKALLKGILIGPDGNAMIATHTRRGERHYRYYITHTASKQGHKACSIGMVRAGEIEGIVFDQLKVVLQNPSVVARTVQAVTGMGAEISPQRVQQSMQSIDELWNHLHYREQVQLLRRLVEQVRLEPEGVHIELRTLGIAGLILDIKAAAHASRSVAA